MGDLGNSFATSLGLAFDEFEATGKLPQRHSGASGQTSENVLEAAAALRLALAIRGRLDPNTLLDKRMDGNDRLAVLDLVLRDCSVDATGWVLKDHARRRELENAGPERVVALLNSGGTDDVGRALTSVFAESRELQLRNLSVEELRTLLDIEPAVIGLAPAYPDPAEVRRLLALRSRLNEFLRFSSNGFVGREAELKELLGFIRADSGSKHRVASLLLWGTGGIGKSSLIAAALATVMREENSQLVPVHLDFDRRDLAIENTIGLSLELLRQVGTIDPEADKRLKALRDRLRDDLSSGYQLGSKKASESSASEVLAGLRGCLSFLRVQKKRIVLVLDTFENVENSGHRALVGLRRWIEQLALVSGAPQIRLIVAGRTDPSYNGLRKALSWAPKTLVRELENLTKEEACTLLGLGGVPLSTSEAIYAALGGNPLVLSLIKKMVADTGDLSEIENVASDVMVGLIPPAIVQGVLYDRFLKHVPSKDARTYAHPGLVLPEITPDLIRSVLGPLKGEPAMTIRRSHEIFEALASASWLVYRQGETLLQRRDVRRLTLTMMTADPTRAAEVERVRLQAMLYHAASRSIRNRGALAYHLLMRVRVKEDLDLLDGVNLSGTGSYIRKMAEDLPDRARAFVEVLDFESGIGRSRRAIGARSIPAEQALAELPDDLWFSFISGDDARSGEGDRLVEHGDPSTALDLWRRRPAGPESRPPTFVLRALAETGEWNGPEADIDALTQEWSRPSKESGRPRSDERLYWSICYALLVRPLGFARDSDEFRPLILQLKRYHERRQKSAIGQNMVALSAIVEGLCEERIVPDRYFISQSPYATCTRLHLQRGRWSGRVVQWQVDLAQLITLQKSFASAFSNKHQDVIRTGSQLVFQSLATNATANTLKAVQSDLNALQGKPLVQVQRLLDTMKRKATVRAGRHEASDRALEVRLLRGTTPELHRPARQALVEALVENRYEATPNRSTLERMTEFAMDACKLLSIRPAEFHPKRFASRAAADPNSALLGFVEFADRARVLESVLLVALDHAIDDSKLVRVLSTLRAWDWALARQSADWTAGEYMD